MLTNNFTHYKLTSYAASCIFKVVTIIIVSASSILYLREYDQVFKLLINLLFVWVSSWNNKHTSKHMYLSGCEKLQFIFHVRSSYIWVNTVAHYWYWAETSTCSPHERDWLCYCKYMYDVNIHNCGAVSAMNTRQPHPAATIVPLLQTRPLSSSAQQSRPLFFTKQVHSVTSYNYSIDVWQ